MKLRPMPSKERLDELLTFNPDTGEIRWKAKHHNKANRIKVGNLAGSIWTEPKSGKQYIQIMIDGVLYKAHRLAHYYYTGEQPPEVDHKNGNGLDNRKDNLRNAPYGINHNNREIYKNNTTGVIGVSFNKRMELWIAYYGSKEFQKKHRTSKYFQDFFEAVCCRKSWENQYGMTELKKHRKN